MLPSENLTARTWLWLAFFVNVGVTILNMWLGVWVAAIGNGVMIVMLLLALRWTLRRK